MKLIYEATGEEVKIGDTPTMTRDGVVLQGIVGRVIRIQEPDRPWDSGRVYLHITPIPSGVPVEACDGGDGDPCRGDRENYEGRFRPSEIGAVWV
jgi:hypothetical protein